MKTMRSTLGLILSALFICLLVSCGGRAAVDTAELAAALEELAPRAHELYGIIYGDGLERQSEPEPNGYYLVTDERYSSIAELREDLREVFTDGYAEVLENTAFRGVSTDEGAIGSKLMQGADGRLYVKPEVTADFAAPREFVLSDIRVVRSNPYRTTVELTTSGGEAAEVTLQREDGIWKLDTAMY